MPLLKALSTRKAFLQKLTVLWLATMGGGALAFFTQVILARSLSVEQFGAFVSALALVTLFTPLAGFGLFGYWLNIFGKEGWAAFRWVRLSFVFLAATTVLAFVSLSLVAVVISRNPAEVLLVVVVAPHILGQIAMDLSVARYQLEGRNTPMAFWQLFPHLVRFVLVACLLLVYSGAQLSEMTIGYAYSFAAAILCALAWKNVLDLRREKVQLDGHGVQQGGSATIAVAKPEARDLAAKVWPFGLEGFFYLIYFQSDIVMIKHFLGESAAGVYNTAFVIIAAIYIFPSVLYQRYLVPRLHRWAHHDVVKLKQVYGKGNVVMLVLGVVVMLSVWLAGPVLLPLIFGADYKQGVSALMLLAVAIPLRFVSTSAGSILMTRDFMRHRVRLMGGAALFNVVLNFYLVPLHGIDGAAVATVLSELLLLMMFLAFEGRYFSADGMTDGKG